MTIRKFHENQELQIARVLNAIRPNRNSCALALTAAEKVLVELNKDWNSDEVENTRESFERRARFQGYVERLKEQKRQFDQQIKMLDELHTEFRRINREEK